MSASSSMVFDVGAMICGIVMLFVLYLRGGRPVRLLSERLTVASEREVLIAQLVAGIGLIIVSAVFLLLDAHL